MIFNMTWVIKLDQSIEYFRGKGWLEIQLRFPWINLKFIESGCDHDEQKYSLAERFKVNDQLSRLKLWGPFITILEQLKKKQANILTN